MSKKSNDVLETTKLEALKIISPSEIVEMTRLSAGITNFVYRATMDNGSSIIIKHTPSHVAVDESVVLSDERGRIERSFLAFATGLSSIRAPRLIGAVRGPPHVIVMEDVGELPSLGQLLRDGSLDKVVDALGHSVGCLHALKHSEEEREQFLNFDVQAVRYTVAYEPMFDNLLRAGVEEGIARIVGDKASELGKILQEKRGTCLIHGDLWLESILVDTSKSEAVLIDWEFGHYGRPLQDIAHLAAHFILFIYQTTNVWPTSIPFEEYLEKSQATKLWTTFINAYFSIEETKSLWTREELNFALIHIACELQVRTIGKFPLPKLENPISVIDTILLLSSPEASDTPLFRWLFGPLLEN